jgi:hypothetical protein
MRQIPHAVDIALPRFAEKPRIEYPPVSFHWFSGPAFTSGIEAPTVDGQKLRVYSAEKSVADAFKYRSNLGLDVALEALRTWRGRRGAVVERLFEQARVCRVERVMRSSRARRQEARRAFDARKRHSGPQRTTSQAHDRLQ